LKAELEAAERKAREEREGKKEQVAADTIPRLELRPDEARLLGLKRKAPTEIPPPPPSAALDADDASSEEEETSSSSSSSGDDDDEDEEAALERELEKIRKEREEEKARREALEKQRRDAQALSSNPLIQLPGQQPPVDFVIKKKWYEDTVFRNQARGEPDNKKKRFINDTTRNDFHRKFLDKFIL
jgi:protein CWC15